ncbi:hypothetical protein RQP46_006058 [Phenoliferia psychrophenolica]
MSENITYFRQFTLMSRKEGTTPAEFKAHWSGKHADLAMKIPEFMQYVQRYEQCYPLEGNEFIEFPGGLKCDGLVVMDFKTLADREALLAAPGYMSVLGPDTIQFADPSKNQRVVAQRATFVEQPATQEVYFRQFTFMNRKEGVSPAQYKAHWSGTHATLAKSIPMFTEFVQNYQQCYPLEGDEFVNFPGGLTTDGLVIMEFKSLADREKLVNAPEYLSVLQPDTIQFADLSGIERVMVQRRRYF